MIACGHFQSEPACDSLCCYLLLDGGFQTPTIFLDVLVVFRVGSGRWTCVQETFKICTHVGHPQVKATP